ncbi:hypothetical protein [Acinetobacter sp.]|uniref:hypothetical protein n=1 Tax=Acinetobacter sp. TaxID=472 RepID=UPI0035B38762
MEIKLKRKAFENWWEKFHNGRQIACDYVEEDNSYSVGYANAQWVAWQAANRHIDDVDFAYAQWVARQAAKAVPEGFVLVPKDQFESLNEFKGLYKRAIINARKRKDQLNWAHVAGLGVGSGRAVELCKMLNIDPGATNMHEVIEAQEQGHV